MSTAEFEPSAADLIQMSANLDQDGVGIFSPTETSAFSADDSGVSQSTNSSAHHDAEPQALSEDRLKVAFNRLKFDVSAAINRALEQLIPGLFPHADNIDDVLWTHIKVPGLRTPDAFRGALVDAIISQARPLLLRDAAGIESASLTPREVADIVHEFGPGIFDSAGQTLKDYLVTHNIWKPK